MGTKDGQTVPHTSVLAKSSGQPFSGGGGYIYRVDTIESKGIFREQLAKLSVSLRQQISFRKVILL